jgi:transposase
MRIANSSTLQVDRRARRIKTDVIDVEALLRALMAYRRGEMQICRMVRPPTVEQEDARRPVCTENLNPDVVMMKSAEYHE